MSARPSVVVCLTKGSILKFGVVAQMEGMHDVLDELRESRRFKSRVIPAVVDGPSQDSDVTRGRQPTQVELSCACSNFGPNGFQQSSNAQLLVLEIWPACNCVPVQRNFVCKSSFVAGAVR